MTHGSPAPRQPAPPSAAPRRRTGLLAAVSVVAVIAVAAVAVGLWAFQPWKVFTSSTVDEALPSVPAAASPSATLPSVSDMEASKAPSARPTPAPPAEPVVLAQGDFVTQEHDTSGVAKIVELADGSRFLRFENLATSDGPDLHVWLTDQTAGGEWGKYDDSRFVPLGALKATNGNQNYEIPAGADLAGLTSVVIWCDRFNVAFGSAALPL